MRSRTVFGAVSGAAGMAVAIAMLAAGPARADEIPWVKSFQSAMSQAKASNKLVMADFYTDW